MNKEYILVLFVFDTGVDVQKLGPILVSTCQVLLQSTRELPSVKELQKPREGHDNSERSFAHTELRLKVCHVLYVGRCFDVICSF